MNGDAIEAPLEVHLHRGGQTLELRWVAGPPSRLDAGLLRRACGCAHCEAARRRGAPPSGRAVTLDRVELAGPGALQLFFSDGHDRGRFPWAWLLELATDSPGALNRFSAHPFSAHSGG